jgi:hypothetical protein
MASEPPSSPPGPSATVEDTLGWYKAQYEQLESELAEFRDSSRELEQELEKDIERAEKQERYHQEKAETLGFEVEEWKVCHVDPLFPTVSETAALDILADSTALFALYRGNIGNPRPRLAHPRMRSRRKSQLFEIQTELCN